MWDQFVKFLIDILGFFAGFLGDWGLAIIVLTIIIRLILTPFTIKSTISSAKMQILQPQMKEIQNKYKEDPVRQNSEIRKLYSENQVNPLGGCLPLLFQMPIFFGLFAAFQKVPQGFGFYNILPSLSESVQGAVASMGWSGAWVYLFFDILFGVLTFIPLYLNQRTTDAQGKQTLMMGAVMGIMMLWFGWGVPSGVLLYYNASALWGLVQQVFITQQIINKYKTDESKKYIAEPIQVDVVRKEKKQRPHKKA